MSFQMFELFVVALAVVENTGVENLSNLVKFIGIVGSLAGSFAVVIDFCRINMVKWMGYSEKEKAIKISFNMISLALLDIFCFFIIKIIGEDVALPKWKNSWIGSLVIIILSIAVVLLFLLLFKRESCPVSKKIGDWFRKTPLSLNIITSMLIGVLIHSIWVLLPCVNSLDQGIYSNIVYFSGLISFILLLIKNIDDVKSWSDIKIGYDNKELFYYFKDDGYIVCGTEQNPDSKNNELMWIPISELKGGKIFKIL